MKVGVIGAGTMGQGIAKAFAQVEGFTVALCDIKQEWADNGKAKIAAGYAKLVAKGKLEQAEVDRRMAAITAGLKEDLCADCDLIVEAAFEDMKVKQTTFGELDKICKPECVFASNTSSLSITEIGKGLSRPLVGMHFFNPADRMKLIEVIAGVNTPAETVETIKKISTEIGKTQNNYGHCLHGGPNGFQYRVFDAVQPNPQEVELTYVAADGEEGFPGNITCKVLMKLTDDNAIDIRYEAETDKPTIVNMTNHSYFNLDGDAANNADHLLMVDADYYTPVDSTFMTTGEIVPVEGTPMDFRTPTPVGARINDYDFVQLKNGNGYDHNWVLNAKGDINRRAASLKSQKTGIVLDVYTNEPGVQVYAGNFLDGSLTGKKGITYNQRASVCLETQKYPDTPNKPEWPSAVLRPGEKYMSQCIFKFSVDK